MIAYVRGLVTDLRADVAVIEVGGAAGAIGLELICGPGTLAQLREGQQATLAAALIVREDSLTLYGFTDDDERTVFDVLQTVSGVGPRLAQAALSVHRPDALRKAVATDDLVALMKIPGVGRKGAQRMALELKDRLGPPLGGASAGGLQPAATGWAEQVHAGLVALGWSPRDADSAVVTVAASADQDADVSTLLRLALQSLDRS